MDGHGLADVLADGLEAVFIGINPASASAAIGHSFASPGNRFWPAMYASGFTATLMRPEQEQDLLALRLGITSIVRRPTPKAGALTRQELVDGGRDLAKRLADIRPRWAVFLGVTGYRAAFAAPQAYIGPQAVTIAGGRVWVLPNPSGRNAHFPPTRLAAEFTRLRIAAGLPDRRDAVNDGRPAEPDRDPT